MDPLTFHREQQGKICIKTTKDILTQEDLALTYTPGVAEASRAIVTDPKQARELTGRNRRVAVVTDGTAVLGLGNIGPLAALPVMEGKAALFKAFGDVDAFPLCLESSDTEELIRIIQAIAPSFGGINLEDIAAPRCFEIEERLKETLDIPVFHDDQHGTAIVVLAGLTNAFMLTNRTLAESTIVISGAGAAGTAIARILLQEGAKTIYIVDSHGIISRNRSDLSTAKTFLAATTNPQNIDGSLEDALKDADVFIGVSAPNLLSEDMVRSMADHPIIFAMANPDPEIMPDRAKAAGAAIVATGRSDFPNQVNNVLVFPGIFRGALDAHAKTFTHAMKVAAAKALAEYGKPAPDRILPDPLDRGVARAVADAVRDASAICAS